MAESIQSMNAGESLGFAIDADVMFSDRKGRYKKSIARRQLKFARSLPDLNRFMEAGEKVRIIARGCSPMGIMEQIITGTVIVYVKRALFVFTDKRIFHIPATRSYRYRNSIAEIRYADCESIRLSGGTLAVKYKSGVKEKFHYQSRGERGKIKDLLDSVSFQGAPSPSMMRNHLCPRCTKMLERDVYTCASCRLAFKSLTEGRLKSIIYPGGGYFYTGHLFLGLADAFVEVILILLVVAALIDIINGVPESGGVLIVFGIFLFFEKLISIYHSNHFLKEFIPKDKKITPVEGI